MLTGLALAPLPREAVFTQDAVHCRVRTQVDAFVEECRPALGDTDIHETIRAQHVEHRLFLDRAELGRVRPARESCRTGLTRREATVAALTVMTPRPLRHTESVARQADTDTWYPRVDIG